MTTATRDTILEAASAAYAAGLCVVPVPPNGSKTPRTPHIKDDNDVTDSKGARPGDMTNGWADFQLRRPTRDEMDAWFHGQTQQGLGLICGKVSGGLEMLEFEDEDRYAAFQNAARAAGMGDVLDRVIAGYEETTPGGGVHLLYRVPTPPGNTKLASRPCPGAPACTKRTHIVGKSHVLIETRGEGGFVVVAPSHGRVHETGRPYVLRSGGFDRIVDLPIEDREEFVYIAKSLDEMPEAPSATTANRTGSGDDGDAPGARFNADTTVTIETLLTDAGWTHVSGNNWRRPGKSRGISATVGFMGLPIFRNFSSSVDLPTNKALDKFGLYTWLHHGGDFSAAARALYAQGYHGYDPGPLDAEARAGAKIGGSPPPAELRSLAEAEATFARWLGDKYDLDALRFVLATAAAERLDGDPLWALIISGSGAAKTETVGALSASGAIITSTITSEGALLSASSRREVAKDATGGLLRRLGSSGVLVIKDVTSVLSMNRDARAAVLAALREVHDGRWERNVGVDGGKTLTWEGRVAIIGAVTTAWDRAHDVIASMGDRFVTLRIDSTIERMAAGRRAIANTGVEVQMREELAAAVAGVLAGIQQTPAELTEDEQEHVLAAADLVTTARTGVDYDYRGDVIDANAPEMPTRFAKQLAQVMRGGLAIGMTREDALRLAIRCARDSMPPLRLEILEDVGANPDANTTDVRKRLGKPRSTVDRQLQSLQMLGLLNVTEAPDGPGGKSVWYWRLAEGVDTSVLASPEKSPTVCRVEEEESSERDTPRTNISGDGRCPRCGGPIYANRKPLECFAPGCEWKAPTTNAPTVDAGEEGGG